MVETNTGCPHCGFTDYDEMEICQACGFLSEDTSVRNISISQVVGESDFYSWWRENKMPMVITG